jgi:hypothetical protein
MDRRNGDAGLIPEYWQPPQWVDVVDDIYTRVIYLEYKDFVVPQHIHTYEHTTLLAHGSVRLYKNRQWFADYHAPKLIKVEANTEHYFQSLEDHTVICCIHNTHGMDDVSIEREGKLEG